MGFPAPTVCLRCLRTRPTVLRSQLRATTGRSVHRPSDPSSSSFPSSFPSSRHLSSSTRRRAQAPEPNLEDTVDEAHEPREPLSSARLWENDDHPGLAGENEVGFGEGVTERGESFEDYAGELRRRKKADEAKRRQNGSRFVDHLIIQVRGGKGGSGTAAFQPTRTGALGPPSGGNGGQGGSVYLTTSEQLSSLVSLSRHYTGGQGGSGLGDARHGKRGEDVYLTVPIGTVLKEIKRQGEEERDSLEDESALPIAEKQKRHWERVFVRYPGNMEEVSPREFKEAENAMRRMKRWSLRTPDFEAVPPVEVDIERTIEEPILLAKGGQGGLGNPFFARGGDSYKARLASKGVQSSTSTFQLELKLLADVGLVGLPNAGKSTLLRGLTGRRAEVAGYEFTTLNPQVGVVRVFDDGSWAGRVDDLEVLESWEEREVDEESRARGEYRALPRSPRIRDKRDTNPASDQRPVQSSDEAAHDAESRTVEQRTKERIEVSRFSISDNPGLLARASENVGLGHSFLRSIERSLALSYVLDLTRNNPEEDLEVLRQELEAYKSGLAGKAGVVVLNKADEVDEQVGRERVERVKRAISHWKGAEEVMEVVVLSGKFGLGLDRLVLILREKVDGARREKREDEERMWREMEGSDEFFEQGERE